ncbi:Uncharacterised protein [Mycobacteroides abscessus subsp. abscessus]|nr:Uncharacterised protein [Mycobacteroides abscessus subsp. abscessus]
MSVSKSLVDLYIELSDSHVAPHSSRNRTMGG